MTHTPRERTGTSREKIFFSKNVDHLDQSPINGVQTPFVMIQPFGSAWINMDQRAAFSTTNGDESGHDNSCPRKYGSFGSVLIRH